MKKSLKKDSIILFVIITFMSVGFMILCLSSADIKDYSKKNDYIPAITESVGKRNFNDTKHGKTLSIDESLYGYKSIIPLSDIYEYYIALCDIGYIVTVNNTAKSEGSPVMTKRFADTGKIVRITMEYSAGRCGILIEKDTETPCIYDSDD